MTTLRTPSGLRAGGLGLVLVLTLLGLGCSSAGRPQAAGLEVRTLSASVPLVGVLGTPAPSGAWARPSPARAPSLAQPVAAAAAMKPEACLACHGSYEAIAAKSKDYVNEFGDKVNPHVYVPHDTKDLPDCLSCHTSHPIPPAKGSVKVGNITMDYCFSCHHTQTFEKCSSCHEK